ncbi:hypothetical protein V2J09_010189 [Rumex salicifolius]
MGSFPNLSNRSLNTESPVMVKILELSEGTKDVMPLGQGAVYWNPPEEALKKISEIAREPLNSRYGAHEGIFELKEALLNKLKVENKLCKSSVMGFLNVVLSVCDVTDSVVLFAPYFFNAYLSFKMTGLTNIIVGPTDPDTLQPDADWLEKTLEECKPVPRIVSIVNPGNPSGTCMTESLLQRISEICGRAGSWLVVDNAYEYFIYGNSKHLCVEGKHVINLFSFSKAYGMMGWRVGYIAYSSEEEGLRTQLLKMQDNIAICTPVISQRVALACMETEGREWVRAKVKILERNKDLVFDSLSPLGESAVKGGQGSIFLWAKLPDEYRDVDMEVVAWLVRKHRVVVLPGSACGVPGCIRVTFGAIKEAECEIASRRLRRGLEELVRDGMVE